MDNISFPWPVLLRRMLRTLAVLAALAAPLALVSPATQAASKTYSENEVLEAAETFFGVASKALADVVGRVFKDLGEPTGFITGEEISGAFIFGLRYGQGALSRKGSASMPVFWQGPSIGFDVGGNAAKAFVLVYNLDDANDLFQRFPGVEGSFYLVAGIGVNYQQSGSIVLAPIRTGVGLRAGGNVGYLNYTRQSSWFPL